MNSQSVINARPVHIASWRTGRHGNKRCRGRWRNKGSTDRPVGGMGDDRHIRRRPIANPCLTDDQRAPDGAKIMPVMAVAPIIAKHEILIIFEYPGTITARLAEAFDIRFLE